MVADIMVVAGVDIMAVAMVMEVTTVILVLVCISAHRFILILTTATLISTPIIIRQPWSPYHQHRRFISSNHRLLPDNTPLVTGITATILKAIILI